MLPQSEHQPITPLSAAAMETVTYFVVFHKASTCLVEKEPAKKLFAARAVHAQVVELLGLGSGMGFLGWQQLGAQLRAAASGCHLNSLLEVLQGAGGHTFLPKPPRQTNTACFRHFELHRFQFFYVFNPLKLGVMLMLLPERTSS